MYQSYLTEQKQDRGMLLVAHQGELKPGDEHSFMPTEGQFAEYAFGLVVEDDAATPLPSEIKASVEGRNIILRFPKLRMSAPAKGGEAYRPKERFLFTFLSARSPEMSLEFTVSLILDGNARVEQHYLAIKPDHLPEAYTPPVNGPLYHLAIWGNTKENKLNLPTTGGLHG